MYNKQNELVLASNRESEIGEAKFIWFIQGKMVCQGNQPAKGAQLVDAAAAVMTNDGKYKL